MNREQLIDNLRLTILATPRREGEDSNDWARRQARHCLEALDVFEQATTPSDDEREPSIKEIAAAFQEHAGAPTWKDDPVARDDALRWHMRGFKDGIDARRPVRVEREALVAEAERGNRERQAKEQRELFSAAQRLVQAEPTVTDKMREAAARALFEDPLMPAEMTWDEVAATDPTRAEIWRADAHRVVTAALAMKEGEQHG